MKSRRVHRLTACKVTVGNSTFKCTTSPLHEKFAILIKFNNSAVAVTIRHKEVSIRHDSNSGRFAEVVIIIARNEGDSKSEKCFPTSLWELEYLMQSNICHPYIVVDIHSESMRKVEPAKILPNYTKIMESSSTSTASTSPFKSQIYY